MKGQPLEQWQIEEFAAEYLISGNIAKCARELGIPHRTAFDLAMRLDSQPDFASRRLALRAGALARATARVEAMADAAADRFHDPTGGIDVKQMGGKDGATVITDKRADYGRLLVEAERNAHALARLERELNGEEKAPTEVIIRVAPSPQAAARLESTAESPTDPEKGDKG